VSTTFQSSGQTPVRPEPVWKSILECSAIEVFNLMANVHLTPAPAAAGEPHGDRTAMVGMAGALCGMTTIRCSGEIAAKLATQMLGADATSNPSTVSDALGELCNMVAGNFKSKISNLADHCMLSVPTVISGEDYTLEPASPVENFIVDFEYDAATIWICLTVHG